MTSFPWRLVVACGLGLGCGAGTVVDFGAARPPEYIFGAPRLLTELDTSFANENPTLTTDLLEIVYNSDRITDGRSDVWTARRSSVQVPFNSPSLIEGVSSPDYEKSPAIALDGLSIYVGSDRPGGLGDMDIWRATRPSRDAGWGTMENLAALNSPGKDIPRPLGQHDLLMPLQSERDTPTVYQTYFSVRPSRERAFGTPVIVPELVVAGVINGDAFMTADGLTIFYSSAPVGGVPDIFVAWRRNTSQPFSYATPVMTLNTEADERDPWLSPDETVFYFTSDRTGLLQIYEAPVTRRPASAN